MRAGLLWIILAIAGLTSAPASPAPISPAIDSRINALVGGFAGKVTLHAQNLDTGATFSIGGDEPVRTASTIKVAVMIEAFAQVAAGRLHWNDQLTLSRESRTAGSGILPAFGDGLTLTLRDAVNLMMMVSDNTATNLVIDRVTADAVNVRMASLGLTATRLMRRIGSGGESADGKLSENQKFGTGRSSPREMVRMLELLERGEVVDAAASREMLALMKREQGGQGIWRAWWKYPKATKSGALDRLRSNVGILYHPRGRIALAITCDDMPEIVWTVDNPALLLMSQLSELVTEALLPPAR
jgi:beta-lactamase class A